MMPRFRFPRNASLVVLVSSLLWWAFPGVLHADSVVELYGSALSQYNVLLAASKHTKNREAWEKCAHAFLQVMEEDKEKVLADKCCYLIGQSYHHMFDSSGNRDDYENAVKYYRIVTDEYPGSPLADDALYVLGIIHMSVDPAQAYDDFQKVSELYPTGDMASMARQRAARLRKRYGNKRDAEGKKEASDDRSADVPQPLPPQPSQPQEGAGNAPRQPAPPASDVSASTAAEPSVPAPAPSPAPCIVLDRVEHWSTQDYTRVVVYLDGSAAYEGHTIAPVPSEQLPERVYLDFDKCVMGSRVKPHIPVGDEFLKGVRVGQYSDTVTRVVLDTKSMESYKIFSLADPFRVVIDIHGKKAPVPRIKIPKRDVQENVQEEESPSPESLVSQLGLGVRCIVIDPGHGGIDNGATGPGGVLEKDVALDIAGALKTILEARAGCEVILTRTDDRYVSLEERTAIANANKADLFISIHTNGHRDRSLRGIETYFLSFSKDKESARVAAIENASSKKRISDLEKIVHALVWNTKISESSRLATSVQQSLIEKLKGPYEDMKDLGVKQAPFYVFLGAEMPSILVEAAFITNEREESLLKDKAFQESLASGIALGIESYMRRLRHVARVGEKR